MEQEQNEHGTATRHDFAWLMLRLAVGATLLAHGLQKLTGYEGWLSQVESLGLPLPAVAAPLAIVGEVGGGAMLLLGAITPVGALLAASTMAVAIGTVHLTNGFFAKDGGFEFPLLLLTGALAIGLGGPGRLSVDQWVRWLRSKRPTEIDTIHERPASARERNRGPIASSA